MGVAGADEKFRFLTMDEFSRLSQKEKIVYLEQAAEQIGKSRTGKPQRSLFRDGLRNLPRSRKKQQ